MSIKEFCVLKYYYPKHYLLIHVIVRTNEIDGCCGLDEYNLAALV